MDRDALIDRLRGLLEARPQLACAWLFGSRARGTSRPGSDADVAVLWAGEPPATLAGSAVTLAGEMEAALGLPVDGVTMNRAPLDLVRRVMQDGVLLVERDASARVRFEVEARNRWFDLEPILRGYREAAGRHHGRPCLVLKKLAFVETCVQQLRTMARPDAIEHDLREERFVVHTLQLAAQAALDVASHVVSDRRLGEPETNLQMFELLRAAGWLDGGTAAAMRDLAGFRNVVHGYERVDLRIVRDVVEHRLTDLLDFCVAVRLRLDRGD